jgi:putative sigma-54 modulation protein
MKLRIQSLHFDADKKLLDFIQKKSDKLEQFFDRIIGGEVILRLENSIDDKNKIVEFKLLVPGNEFFAKEKCKSFEEATDLAITSIQKQVQKYKGKITDHVVDKEAFYLDEMAD